MRHGIVTLAIAATLAIPAAATSANKPVCHWTHFKRGDTTYYVQHCNAPRHVTKHHASKWNQAGPGNSTVKPRIH